MGKVLVGPWKQKRTEDDHERLLEALDIFESCVPGFHEGLKQMRVNVANGNMEQATKMALYGKECLVQWVDYMSEIEVGIRQASGTD